MAMEPTITYLGQDPPTVNRLNACSFQQDALTTYAGWQYAAFYTAKPSPTAATADTPRLVNLSRRRVDTAVAGEWETLTFEDYEQKTDDGHNTISIGISHGDGMIHLSYDHHCDR